VSGGAGFIGSHIVDALLANGWRVRVLDDFSSGSEANLAGVIGRVEILRSDVRDEAAVIAAAEGVDVVFHQAAIASVQRSVEEPLHTHSVNLDGTLRVLDAARRCGCRRVVLASSSAVYGDSEGVPARESDRPNPVSPYAVQKLAAEQYLGVYGALHGLETVALRYFNVYGPRQDSASDYAAVVPIFLNAALCGKPLHLHGDGEQSRDFVHVSDVARSNLLAADALAATGRCFNIASGRGTRVIDLVSILEAALGRRLDVVREPARAGDIRRSQADTSLGREALGFEPGVTLAVGIRHAIETLGGMDKLQEVRK
jgi:UDP-glucose 4-epimerase